MWRRGGAGVLAGDSDSVDLVSVPPPGQVTMVDLGSRKCIPCHMASIPLIVSYVAGQEKGMRTRSATFYVAAFTDGLFNTIALVGFICALLGRMLGDVGPGWTIAVGAVLIWVALDMLGIQACSLSGGLMARLRVRGVGGTFLLGLAYGILVITNLGVGGM